MEKLSSSLSARLNRNSWTKLTDDDLPEKEKKPSDKDNVDEFALTPRLSAEWPRHLKALYEDLSNADPAPEVQTAIELLHALKLDKQACKSLCTLRVVAKMIDALKDGTMHFRDVLTSPPSFSIRIFQHLLLLDVHAARRFVRFCSPELHPCLVETDAYGCMHALLQSKTGLSHMPAKRERELFVSKVEMLIKAGAAVCAKELAPFIRGCPECARKKVLKLLANEEVRLACKLEEFPYELADAIRNLEVRADRSKADPKLGLLLAKINTEMSEVEEDAQEAAKARKEKSSGLRCLMDDRVVALIEEVEDKVKDKRLDLQTLVARLCPGQRTTQAQAKFVAGLMGHLIQRAHERREPIDYEGLVWAALQSEMPRSCTVWIARAVVGALPSAEEARRLIAAMEAIIAKEAPQHSKALTFPQSAKIVSDDAGKPIYITSPSDEPKSRISLEWVIDYFIGAVLNTRANTRSAERGEREPTGALGTARAEQQAVVDSVSADVQGALKLIETNAPWKEELSYATAMCQQEELSLQQVVDEFVRVDNTAAFQFLGVLAAALLVQGDSKRFTAFVVAIFDRPLNQLLPQALARGLVNTWYEAQHDSGKANIAVIQELTSALLDLKEQVALSTLPSHCRTYMMRRVIATPTPRNYRELYAKEMNILDQLK